MQRRYGIYRSVDTSLKSSKFQQEAMARQIRFYRSRHQQLRAVIEKLRSENLELKRFLGLLHLRIDAHGIAVCRTNDMLAQESEQFKHQFGYQDFGSDGGHEPLNVINQNGKRPMGNHVYQWVCGLSSLDRMAYESQGMTTLQTDLALVLALSIIPRHPLDSLFLLDNAAPNFRIQKKMHNMQPRHDLTREQIKRTPDLCRDRLGM